MNLPWRRLLGNRVVRRHVLGVDLYLPWSHPLPDYTRGRSDYGLNLILLARGLASRMGEDEGPIRVLDIGANVGDSAAQILADTDARVLCVEADPYWVRFLRMNVGGDPRVAIEEVLLVPDEELWAGASPVRAHGTTRFTTGEDGSGAMPAMSVRALRDAHPDFDRIRLVKSDTDGFDTALVPAVARTWSDRPPVVFFEFDPTLARTAGDQDPDAVWATLAGLGYRQLAVWDNGGDPLGLLDVEEAARAAASLDPRDGHLGYYFWDVAACHRDDAAAIDTVTELVPEEFSVKGIWR